MSERRPSKRTKIPLSLISSPYPFPAPAPVAERIRPPGRLTTAAPCGERVRRPSVRRRPRARSSTQRASAPLPRTRDGGAPPPPLVRIWPATASAPSRGRRFRAWTPPPLAVDAEASRGRTPRPHEYFPTAPASHDHEAGGSREPAPESAATATVSESRCLSRPSSPHFYSSS